MMEIKKFNFSFEIFDIKKPRAEAGVIGLGPVALGERATRPGENMILKNCVRGLN
ncbi:MAG TPA: hypothetical protein PKD95_03135 [Candidatus Paceibacterota bacterium]|nr:hypothetical protein [Candidatus Paceibacterota bacterium]